ncbi:alkaline phosphatase [Verminephrobacter aporrectodeae subsp. tuberculatae]|uniref:Alkaline phosphatase n=1 Tax=Verminephrobacter aporrectodeae subsp. tuberculatae TaxID=1110392 RepID=A0ABT3KSX1_9BURK|nr:alkaline phosphatase D family protein [Verminephrobacter aporrectodeae]MCW5222312.1 alkaline phosphatase [Verminephrobacter aporrectodeae subsp. tuberculatae]MCW5287776.1 alkaline phosphatase [Verminephrobacter aporrectodeae subsp. tuberculatae]MCW5321340.1 alkaline phosphatase [Verminephrobacter aporrectodeae subsp. tuberculatae]MCW8165259.1 alkaline phosphatase [Verminephrobacter aporrectodeae subsp. tuberculatae]MCW8169395.1 alkaline phosphatase [Verminephrobacter aporrectodeae subsp. tu
MSDAPPFPKSRRKFLYDAALGTSAWIGAGQLAPVLAQQQGPAIVTSERLRPQVGSGVMSGDTTRDAAILWSRTDRPARMVVEYSPNENFKDARTLVGPVALARSDYTARVDLRGLPVAQRLHYRVRFQDLQHESAWSEPLVGSLLIPGGSARDICFAFSGDEAGQGWGIDESRGGFRVYETMRRFKPDFFIHSGDQIYADGPIQAEVKLDDGSLWRNLVTPAKSKVAETLDDYRGNFAYNLMDANKKRFMAEVPFLVQWDDHEVRNNWYPGQVIGAAEKRYQEREINLLVQRARQAMFEYNPFRIDRADPERVYRSFNYGPLLEVFMLDERSYRGVNSPNRQSKPGPDAAFLGAAQTQWIKQSLLRSRATWKLIASDMPISIIVRDLNPDVPQGNFEAWTNADDGKPAGRELELAQLLRFIKQHDIRNVVWVTADVHYASATYYTPEKAQFTDFKPFWEFVGGPLHAGTFGPGEIDHSFGPDVRYVSVPEGMKQNRSPADQLQFFGIGKIDAKTRALTMSLHDVDGKNLFGVELSPEA